MSQPEIKIIGLSASPRPTSNSAVLLANVLAGAESGGATCRVVRLAELNIRPCIHCDMCKAQGICPLADDMQTMYQELILADAIVVASPIYFMSVCAQLKLVIDRCQAFWAYRDNTGKTLIPPRPHRRPGVFLATGARNTESVFSGAKTTMRWFFDSIDTELYRTLTVGNCDLAGEIGNQPDKIKEAWELGADLVRKCLNDQKL